MNRSTTKKGIKILLVFALNILVGLGMLATAQNESINESKSVSITSLDNGGVKIKVRIKKGDDEQIIERTYDSYEAMKDDPELEELGIEPGDFDFDNGRFSFKSNGSNIFFNRGFGNSFFHDDDDDDGSFFFNFDLDSMDSQFRNHFRNFGNGFSFGFGGDDDFGFDIDSLMSQFDFGRSGNMFRFGFGDDDFGIDIDSMRSHFRFGPNGNGFWFNGEEVEDMEQLRERLREQFDDLDFDFDFGDWDDRGFSFHFDDEDGEDGFRVISRAKVFVRSARDADKEKVGADKMDELEIRDISFYPNPSDGRFTVDIRTGNAGPIQVKVIDPDGTTVYDKTDESANGDYSFNVDLSDKRKGIYILQVIQNNSSLTKRVIIE